MESVNINEWRGATTLYLAWIDTLFEWKKKHVALADKWIVYMEMASESYAQSSMKGKKQIYTKSMCQSL